jgi:hypothetical protein
MSEDPGGRRPRREIREIESDTSLRRLHRGSPIRTNLQLGDLNPQLGFTVKITLVRRRDFASSTVIWETDFRGTENPRSHSRAGCDKTAEMAAADQSLTR